MAKKVLNSLYQRIEYGSYSDIGVKLFQNSKIQYNSNAELTDLKKQTQKQKQNCFSMSTYYCVPEMSMDRYEILLRGSSFLVKGNSTSNFPFKYHLVTCGHNIAPWRYREYYPDDFLLHVNERHAIYSIEMTSSNGEISNMALLYPIVYLHPQIDLAVLHLLDEDDAINTFEKSNMNFHALATKDDMKKGKKLTFYGHNVVHSASNANGKDEDDEDLMSPVPVACNGVYEGHRESKLGSYLAPSDMALMQGMSGGPVLIDGHEDEKKLVAGLIEGSVPLDVHAIGGFATFVACEDIQRFINDIEDGIVQGVVGGQAVHDYKRLESMNE